jgi:transposase
MPKKPLETPDPKVAALRERGCFNPDPQRVTDPLFARADFFDARDAVQVKYEMLRRVRVDRQSVADSARAFGLSRPSFYQAQTAFEQGGLPALLPKKPGPRRAHKLGDEVVELLVQLQASEPAISSLDLARQVAERLGLTVHPRSIERALARRKKKHP